MAEGDATLQPARNHRLGDHGSKRAAWLHMLIEMQIHRQIAALGQGEQSIERSRCIAAGVEACSDKIGPELDGALETLHRMRLGEIVARGGERDDIYIKP